LTLKPIKSPEGKNVKEKVDAMEAITRRGSFSDSSSAAVVSTTPAVLKERDTVGDGDGTGTGTGTLPSIRLSPGSPRASSSSPSKMLQEKASPPKPTAEKGKSKSKSFREEDGIKRQGSNDTLSSLSSESSEDSFDPLQP